MYDGDYRVHIKIHVPHLINHNHHVKTVYVHVHDKHGHGGHGHGGHGHGGHGHGGHGHGHGGHGHGGGGKHEHHHHHKHEHKHHVEGHIGGGGHHGGHGHHHHGHGDHGHHHGGHGHHHGGHGHHHGGHHGGGHSGHGGGHKHHTGHGHSGGGHKHSTGGHKSPGGGHKKHHGGHKPHGGGHEVHKHHMPSHGGHKGLGDFGGHHGNPKGKMHGHVLEKQVHTNKIHVWDYDSKRDGPFGNKPVHFETTSVVETPVQNNQNYNEFSPATFSPSPDEEVESKPYFTPNQESTGQLNQNNDDNNNQGYFDSYGLSIGQDHPYGKLNDEINNKVIGYSYPPVNNHVSADYKEDYSNPNSYPFNKEQDAEYEQYVSAIEDPGNSDDSGFSNYSEAFQNGDEKMLEHFADNYEDNTFNNGHKQDEFSKSSGSYEHY